MGRLGPLSSSGRHVPGFGVFAAVACANEPIREDEVGHGTTSKEIIDEFADKLLKIRQLKGG